VWSSGIRRTDTFTKAIALVSESSLRADRVPCRGRGRAEDPALRFGAPQVIAQAGALCLEGCYDGAAHIAGRVTVPPTSTRVQHG